MPRQPEVQVLVDQAIAILNDIGIPVGDRTKRRNERTAVALLAVAGVLASWREAKSLKDGRKLKTREIIAYVNRHFGENISPGSYDDVRREDLKLLVLADLVLNSGDNPSAKTNDPTRGYSLENDFKELLLTYGSKHWEGNVRNFIKLKGRLADKLAQNKQLPKLSVALPDGTLLELGANAHNVLQKDILQEFLPRFGGGCQVLYLGDATKRVLVYEKPVLDSLGFFELGADELPDVIAYDSSRNWLFLVEAVTSSGPMSSERVLELKKLSAGCTAGLIFVTAFQDRKTFRTWASDIAWETEVWIADNPDHMVHFNGDRFLGPHVS